MGQMSSSSVRAKQLRDLIRSADTVLPDHEVEEVAKKIEQSDLPLFTGDETPRTILREAEDTIEARMQTYGHPRENFLQVALGFTGYLTPKLKEGEAVNPHDVAMLMVILKAMRLSPQYHPDSVVDIAGYAEIAAVLAGMDHL